MVPRQNHVLHHHFDKIKIILIIDQVKHVKKYGFNQNMKGHECAHSALKHR